MATTSASLLLHPQLYSFARAYMWQLLRQGAFAEKATEPLQALAQELAQAVAATAGDRDQKSRLLSTVAQYLAGGDLSVPPPGEIHALLRPLLPGGDAPESEPQAAPEAPAPEAPPPAAPPPTVEPPATAADPVSPPSAAVEPPAAAADPVSPPSAAAEASADAPAPIKSELAAAAPDAPQPAAAPESVITVSVADTAAAAPPKSDPAAANRQDTTVEFVVENPPPDAQPVITIDPAAASGPPPETAVVLPPHDLADSDGAPGVSTDVKPRNNKKNRKS